ncbi:MAG: YibE/F family protein [Actinomycetota bacterium]
MGSAHRALLLLVAGVVGVALGAVVWLWPTSDAGPEPGGEYVDPAELVDARLVDVATLDADPDDPTMLADAEVVEVTAELDATGERVVFTTTDETGDTYAEGQRVRLARVEVEGGEDTWFVSDFRRGGALAALVALFVATVLAFGRFQGLRALLGLALTFVVIVGFIVPAILDGADPVAVALAGGVAIMVLTLYLAHGLGPKTTAAVVGTAGALVVTVGLGSAFVELAALTGFTSEEARLANVEVGGLSLQGLLLAGIIIGALGVLDDVTMSQASTVFALRRADPHAGFRRLFAEALSVGRDHVAATVNTLFLAYAGAALPLLILFTTGAVPLGEAVTSEIVAVEIVRTFVGSLGIIAAVPLTTALAALVALERPAGGRRAPSPAAAAGDAPADRPADPRDDAAATDPADRRSTDPADRRSTDPADRRSADPAKPSPERPDAAEEPWVERLREAYGLEDDDR